MSFIRRNWTILATVAGIAVASELLQRRKMIDLEGKVVLITGSSRGLGLAIAEQFALAGAKLALCARDEEELARARMQVSEFGAQVIAIPCDISDPEQVKRCVEQATAHFGQIDILVNNAGVITAGPWQTLTRHDFEESMNIMFWGVYNMTMAVLPQMAARKSGRIVNITSIGGKVSVPHLLAYSSAKFAAVGFSEGLHAELAKDGIVVTTVAPWLMRTGSQVNAIIKGDEHRTEYALFTLLDTLPASSISVKRAAKQVVHATKRGSAELLITIEAQLAARLYGAFPGFMTDLLGIVNRFLPTSEESGQESYTGRESESSLSQSFLTSLGQKASQDYNENPDTTSK
jgi:NAD(P)-dependent dehydrogenase (short-subunit alcohol dehydrogenase family)